MKTKIKKKLIHKTPPAKMFRLRVPVSRPTIEEGWPYLMKPCSCPVAIAVRRALLKKGFEAKVSDYHMTIIIVIGGEEFYANMGAEEMDAYNDMRRARDAASAKQFTMRLLVIPGKPPTFLNYNN